MYLLQKVRFLTLTLVIERQAAAALPLMNGNTRIFYHVPTQTSIYFCEREISFDFPTNHTSLVHWPITSGPHDGVHVQTIHKACLWAGTPHQDWRSTVTTDDKEMVADQHRERYGHGVLHVWERDAESVFRRHGATCFDDLSPACYEEVFGRPRADDQRRLIHCDPACQ